MIRIIDRYMLWRVGLPLLAAISIALAALLLERLIRLLDLFANKGGPLLLILEMLANLVPHYLAVALPAALFIGTLYAAMRLSSDSELDALRGGGLSLGRLIMPIIGLAFLFGVFNFYVMGYLQPYTRYAYRALVYLITETAWDTALERGSFFNGFDNKTILIGNISNGGKVLTQIFVYEKAPNKETTTTAEAGALIRDPQNFSLQLHLLNGTRLETEGGRNPQPVRFSELDLPLYTHSPEPFRERGNKESELDFSELLHAYFTGEPKLEYVDMMSEIHQRIVHSLSILFLPIFAFPIGISSRRTSRTIIVLVGVILMIAYYQVLEFGQSAVENYIFNVYVALWVPFLLFAASSVTLFTLANVRPGQDSFAFLFEAIEHARLALIAPFKKEKTS